MSSAPPFRNNKRIFVPAKVAAKIQLAEPLKQAPHELKINNKKKIETDFYLSKESERYLTDALTNNEITNDELSMIFTLAKLHASLRIGKSNSPVEPTISDIKLAYQIKTLDKLKEIADGTIKFTLTKDKAEPRSPNEIIAHWKLVATIMLERMVPTISS